jgi:hypothetical protein
MNAESNGIRQRLERALYWYPIKRLNLLSFWLNKKKEKVPGNKVRFFSQSDELATIVKLLDKRNFPTYYADLTHEELKPYGVYVYKVINPRLHGLHLDETERVVDIDRLQQVASFFNIRHISLNKTPHPFL